MIRQTEVDGVPTLLAPMAGPIHAGLIFRVGIADETLATTGITHLVEHLALHRHGLTDYHFNGSTGPVITSFLMRGCESDVVTFLAGVCDSLTDLPLDRLEAEKAILRTESSSRSSAVNRQLPLWRYGARDFGLLSYPEWGLHQVRGEDVSRWAATWFTRQNACLWISGEEVPAGLSLRLPAGTRRPLPTPSSALPATPAYFTGPPNTLVLDAVVHRGVAASVAAGVLERELFRSLRQEDAFSYTACTSYDPRGDDYAMITAVADALPERQDAALGGFVDVLAKLKVGRIGQADVDAVRAKAEESLTHPEASAMALPAEAVNLLTGYPNKDPEALLEDLRAVDTLDVHRVLLAAMDSALFMVPEGHTADWAGFVAAPTYSPAPVAGSRYSSLECGDELQLVVGAEGASLVSPAGAATVRYDQCAARLSWPDGARELIGYDAISVRIEPTLFAADPAALAALDAATPPSAVVRMPAREPDAIPKPAPRPADQTGPPTAPGGPDDHPAGQRGWLNVTGMVALGAFIGLLVCVGGLCTAGEVTDQAADGGDWGFLAGAWCSVASLAVPAVFLLRWLYQRGRRPGN